MKDRGSRLMSPVGYSFNLPGTRGARSNLLINRVNGFSYSIGYGYLCEFHCFS